MHVLRLSTADEVMQQDLELLATRTALWVVYASILVHLYAKVITHRESHGLLQMDSPRLADAYTSCEDFDKVTEAYRKAQEAIQILDAAGGKLDNRASWFLRDMGIWALPR
jgi:hypothetical protein